MFAQCSRRFGVELEYNSFDKLSRSKSDNDLPAGIYYLAEKLRQCLNKNVEITKWQYTNNNKNWVLKPDSSCGIEVCSPPYRGQHGFEEFRQVLCNFLSDDKIYADSRCSMHVHVEIEDLTLDQLMNLLQKWINYELMFFLLTNTGRWLNQYCIPIGFCKDFSCDSDYDALTLVGKLSEYKYYSVNLYHYAKNRKKTIEFRCMGHEACMNPEDAANWCKLLLCFVDRCKNNKLLDRVKIEYKKLSDALDFLDLDNYFDDDEVKVWLLSKLNSCTELLDNTKTSESLYFWDSVLECLQDDIHVCVEKLESSLL